MLLADYLDRSTLLALLLVSACAPRQRPAGPNPNQAPPQAAYPATTSRPLLPVARSTERGGLPPVPAVRGPLKISVVYPDSTARVEVEDSSFVFGSLGDGSASLRINGQPVEVAANGAWIAWIPFGRDSIVALRLEARTTTDSARLDYRIHRATKFVPRDPNRLWVDTTAFSPAGRAWWPSGEYLPLSVRASPGAMLTVVLPDGQRIPLAADVGTDPVPAGLRAFDRDTIKLRRPGRADRYRGVLRGVRLGDPGPLLGPETGKPGGEATLEAARGSDTVRVRWPLRLAKLDTLPITVVLDDDRLGAGRTDSITVGRAVPNATYTWFFPTGTRARVTGRVNGDLRLALSSTSQAWVSAAESYPVDGAAAGPAVVQSVTMYPRPDRVVVRIPVGARVPFRMAEGERDLTLLLYGAVNDVNWVRYGAEDSLVALATARPVSADELELRFTLRAPVWGYRTRWEGTDLLLEIRRPPSINPEFPLRGRTIAVDAGHPPVGATGPTGMTEAEANLPIALEVKRLLEAEGAVVLLPRADARPVELWPRVRYADSANAEILVSIHNNALPDGVNPFTNNGSSTFYNHPRALPLARHILRQLVARTGLRDLGVGRGDLALARPTWMPAVLTEGLFMMIPEQEAALGSPAGRHQYALAVVEGLRLFLADRAVGKW